MNEFISSEHCHSYALFGEMIIHYGVRIRTVCTRNNSGTRDSHETRLHWERGMGFGPWITASGVGHLSHSREVGQLATGKERPTTGWSVQAWSGQATEETT